MDKYDCIVVGGGLIGACCTYELIQACAGKIAWLEQGQLGKGTSRAYAGNIFMAAAGYISEFDIEEYELESYGLEFYNNLNHERPDLDLRTVGSLFLGLTEESLTDLSNAFTNELSVKNQEVLDRKEVTKLCEGINSNKIGGAVFHPNSGWVSAERATNILATIIEADGGAVIPNTPVQELLIENGKTCGVLTPDKKIGADNVILATGAWTNSLLQKSDISLSMIPIVAARVMAKEPVLSAQTPVTLIKEKGVYFREENGGILWGGTYAVPPRYDLLESAAPVDLNLLPLDGIMELVDKAKSIADVISYFTNLNRITFSYGAPCHTLDRRAMVGPISEIKGLYFAGGCNEAGVVHAPGFGRLIAESVMGREKYIQNRKVFKPDRFGSRYSKTEIIKTAGILFNYQP
jgi:glycine/D-amino acid oxidase-like deaminating enzyme